MSRRLRILHVVWRLAPGGGEGHVQRALLTNLDPGTFELYACSIRPLTDEDRLDELGTNVDLTSAGMDGPPTLAARIMAITRIAGIAHHIKPDVIHTTSGSALYAIGAAMVARPSGRILEIHDSPASRRVSSKTHMLQSILCRRAGFTPIVHSQEAESGVTSQYGLSPKLCRLLPLGIELFQKAAISRSELRAQLAIDDDAPLVVYVARLVESKRPMLFVDTARLVLETRPDAVFLIAGRGPLKAGIESTVREAGLQRRVRVAGFVEDLDSLYNAADCFLSTSKYEGFGLAIAHAQSAGLPIISPRVGSLPDVVLDGKTGILVDELSGPGGLAQAVLTLLGDESLRKSMSKAAILHARSRLGQSRMIASFDSLYQELGALQR